MTNYRSDETGRDFVISDLTSKIHDGRYQARVAVTGSISGYGLSQRFLDLETFLNEADARQRAISAAEAWIKEELVRRVPLALPTGFIPFS